MVAWEKWAQERCGARCTSPGGQRLASWLAGGDARIGWLIAAMQGRQVICTWVLFFSLLSWGAATGNCQSYGQPIRMVDRAAELAGCVQAQENSAMKGERKKL